MPASGDCLERLLDVFFAFDRIRDDFRCLCFVEGGVFDIGPLVLVGLSERDLLDR